MMPLFFATQLPERAFALGAWENLEILSVIWPIESWKIYFESYCSDAKSLELEFFTN